MSTRATIKIIKEGKDSAYLYHHCDGYPEGVGKDLDNILKNFHKTELSPDELGNKISEIDDEFEIDDCIHGDEEYGYLINLNEHTISCYESSYDKIADNNSNDEYLKELKDTTSYKFYFLYGKEF